MYYKRLVSIYEKYNMCAQFPKELITTLDNFIDWNLKRNKRHLSPYQFANFSGITSDRSLEFFMYYSKKDGIFELVYFLECTSHNCGERIYIEKKDLDDIDGVVVCEECSHSYSLNKMRRYIKVYFNLKDDLTDQIRNERYDPNCAFDVLTRMPDDLKSESPSSSIEPTENEGEHGSSLVSLDKLIEINTSSFNGPIIEDPFLQSVLDYIHD